MKREKKEQVITELKDRFDKAKAIIFTDYRGMTVAELSELRRSLRNGNFHYRVVKNTLAKIASLDTSVSVAQDSFKDPVGITISYDDPVLIVKKILEYSKSNEKLKVRSGIIEGRCCTADELKAVAALPPRKVLLSMLAGALQAPLSKLAGAINATLSSFAYAMNALRDKRGL
ncbi:MAG: 50S ribosomal protein L10 [Nitrospirota bacterium]